MRRSIIGVLITVLAIAGVLALSAARASTEVRVTGDQASAAAREAIAYAGGEWATLAMPTEPGVVLKFHVLRQDGTSTDVLIGEDFHVIRPGMTP